MNATPKANGCVIYRGPSMLNGAPIVVVLILKSQNTKTGDMAQTYILADNGERPTDALRSGADEAICGDCKHRPLNGKTCYVVVRQGATRVWEMLRQNRYPDYCNDSYKYMYAMDGKSVRIGTYGDPAAVPISVWIGVLMFAKTWVGYTHQWRNPKFRKLAQFCMASVDSESERAIAVSQGWRTFRVRTANEGLARKEAVCPASDEGGHKVQCVQCGSCKGAWSGNRGSIAIVLHGNHPKFREQRFLLHQFEPGKAAA